MILIFIYIKKIKNTDKNIPKHTITTDKLGVFFLSSYCYLKSYSTKYNTFELISQSIICFVISSPCHSRIIHLSIIVGLALIPPKRYILNQMLSVESNQENRTTPSPKSN